MKSQNIVPKMCRHICTKSSDFSAKNEFFTRQFVLCIKLPDFEKGMVIKMKWIETTKNHRWLEKEPETINEPENLLELSGEEFQSIEGFGGCFNELGWQALQWLDADAKNDIMKNLFAEEGCNFTFCRLPVGANDFSLEWYSCNEHENDYDMEYFSIERDKKILIPYIKEAMKWKKELKLFASPWSPPTWMKFPRAYNFGTLIWDKKNLDAYALYLTKFIEAYQEEGIKIEQLHVQNEPLSTQKFPSCVWTGEQLRDFIGEYIGPLWEKLKVDCELWLGTINGQDTDEKRMLTTGFDYYANVVLSDKNARKYIKGVSYQWAGKNSIEQTSSSYPQLRYMQSESECGDGDNTWEYAEYIYTLFRHYLVNGAGSYIYWNMILQNGGESTWGWKQNSMITVQQETKEVTYQPEYYVVRHFSQFVHKGAKRIGIKGEWAGKAVGFRNPDKSVVIVVANGLNSPKEFSFRLNGQIKGAVLKPHSFHTFMISQEEIIDE